MQLTYFTMTKWTTDNMDTFAGEYIIFIFCLLILHQKFVIDWLTRLMEYNIVIELKVLHLITFNCTKK